MIGKLLSKIGLAAFLVGISGAFTGAGAAPDPLFEPVIDEIRQELPEGWQFRLPSDIPSEGELYPFISEASDTRLVVSLGITPDCAATNCTIGMIGVTSEADNWPPAGNSVTSVDLGAGVEGYHMVRGEGDASNRLVMWQQDELTYAIVALAEITPEEQLVAIARSMATEAPITP